MFFSLCAFNSLLVCTIFTSEQGKTYFFSTMHSNWLQQCIRPIHYAVESFVSTCKYVILQSTHTRVNYKKKLDFTWDKTDQTMKFMEWTEVSKKRNSKSYEFKSCETIYLHDSVRCCCNFFAHKKMNDIFHIFIELLM